MDILKNSPKAVGQDKVFIAKEKEYLAVEENREKDIPLLVKIVEELKINGAVMGAPFECKEIG